MKENNRNRKKEVMDRVAKHLQLLPTGNNNPLMPMILEVSFSGLKK